MVAITERPKVVPAIIEWPVVDTDWMDEGWDEPCGPATPKLSSLIRLGAMGHPQVRGTIYQPSTGAVCALGAAHFGAFGEAPLPGGTGRAAQRLQDAFGFRMDGIIHVSYQGLPAGIRLRDWIVKLNDSFHHTFDRIAEWLEEHGQ